MISRKILSILLVLVIASLACTLGAPGKDEEEVNSAYPGSEAEYSAPEVSYPAPGSTEQPAVDVQQGVLYPDAQDGSEVPWNQAQAMMQNGEVAKIASGDGSQLTLELKDGRSLATLEAYERRVGRVSHPMW